MNILIRSQAVTHAVKSSNISETVLRRDAVRYDKPLVRTDNIIRSIQIAQIPLTVSDYGGHILVACCDFS